MKTNEVLRRIISALLIFLLFFAAGCAPPPEVFEEEQDERTDEPFNEDGTCYTQSALLPDTVVTGTQNTPLYTLVGDTLLVTDAIPNTQTALVWDLTTNLLTTTELKPLIELPGSTVYLRTHIPMQNGGTLQLLEVHTALSEEPEPPIKTDMVLFSVNADGTTHFTLYVNDLYDDGYAHVVNLYHDTQTGYLYLTEFAQNIMILDANGNVLDILPWPEDENYNTVLVPGEGGSIWMVERPPDIAEWTYSRYDADAHAFVPVVSPNWIGYRIFPTDTDVWYEHTPEGFVLRKTDSTDTLDEQLLVSWVKSGYTDASIRDLHLARTKNGTELLFAVTQNFSTNELSLTMFDPYRPYTAPERNELRLYADETWHTLQEVVVAFNAENVLYRVVYTDSPEDADLFFCNRHAPLPETPLADLYPHMDADIFIQRQHLLPGALSAFENDAGKLQIIPVRTALSLSCNHEEPNKNDYITSPADYLCAVLTHDPGEIDAAPPIIEPIIGLAIPSTAADPNAAWKFISYFLRSETLDTLRSGADEGFSLWQNLFGEQLDTYYGAYAAHRDHRFTFTYPKEEDPETYDPMTNANFAAAVHDGAHYVRFDRDQRGVLAGFFGVHSES